MALAFSLAFARADRSKLARIAMTATTTNNSISVKAKRFAGCELLATGENAFTRFAFEPVWISLTASPRSFGCQAKVISVFGLDMFDRHVTNKGS